MVSNGELNEIHGEPALLSGLESDLSGSGLPLSERGKISTSPNGGFEVISYNQGLTSCHGISSSSRGMMTSWVISSIG